MRRSHETELGELTDQGFDIFATQLDPWNFAKPPVGDLADEVDDHGTGRRLFEDRVRRRRVPGVDVSVKTIEFEVRLKSF